MTKSVRFLSTLLLLVILWIGVQAIASADSKPTTGAHWVTRARKLLVMPMPAYADFDSDAPAATLRDWDDASAAPNQPTLFLLLNATAYEVRLPQALSQFAQNAGLAGNLYLDMNRASALLLFFLLVLFSFFLLIRRRLQLH